MANKSKELGAPESAPPIESRRTPSGDGGVTPDQTVTENEDATALDVPNLGSFSAEAARPTPLDDIADIERSRLPSD